MLLNQCALKQCGSTEFPRFWGAVDAKHCSECPRCHLDQVGTKYADLKLYLTSPRDWQVRTIPIIEPEVFLMTSAIIPFLRRAVELNSTESSRRKSVPTLYETDESKYAGPHAWQVWRGAKFIRRCWHQRAYKRWLDEACDSVELLGADHLEQIDGPCVFVANHASHLDTVVVQDTLPPEIRRDLFFGAAQDRWFVKGKKKLVLKPWYQSLALGNFPIRRGGGLQALEYASWLLEREQHVFLFPEGTRARGDELGEFKHGATLLALRHDVQIVPIYLGGLRDVRPTGSREVKKGRITMEILPPVHFAKGSDVEAATQCLQRRMNRAHARHSSSTGKEQMGVTATPLITALHHAA